MRTATVSDRGLTEPFELELPPRRWVGPASIDDHLLYVQTSLEAAVVHQDEGLALPTLDRLCAHFGLNTPTVWTLRLALVATGHLLCLDHHLFVTKHPLCRNDSTGADHDRD